VEHVVSRLNVSERRACKTIGLSRNVFRYLPRENAFVTRLTARMTALAKEYGRYGYRQITGMLNEEGWNINHKRIERLWRQEGLKVPSKHPKRGRLWLNDGSCVRRRAERPSHVWSYDFIHERTHDGRPLKILTLVDEYTRECLAIDVRRSFTSEDVLARLAELFIFRGTPDYIRSDNGPEFIALELRAWLNRLDVKTLFIEPGSPWENGYIESFNGKFRNELLNGEIFYTLEEARIIIARWRDHYNHKRPHSALGYKPPRPETLEHRGNFTLVGLT
jgi:transposase InsO family protein